MELHIGIIGYNRKQAERILKDVVYNDQETQPFWMTNNKVTLKDNTYYYIIDNYNSHGRRLDQLIVSDVDIINSKLVKEAIMPCLVGSCVPDEFLIQVYN